MHFDKLSHSFWCSNRIMVLSDDVIRGLDIRNQHVSIFNVYAEFTFQSLVYVSAGFNINISTLVSPMSIEWKRNTLHKFNLYVPSIWIDFIQSCWDTIYYSLRSKSRLYLKRLYFGVCLTMLVWEVVVELGYC